jgi:hypothetical protein
LDIEVLELINKCLISKWLFKLLSEEGMWQQLLHNEYLKNKTLAQAEEKTTNSPFWKGFMCVKIYFFTTVTFKVGNRNISGFGKMFGWVIPSLRSSTHQCITLSNGKNVLVSTALS